MPLARQRLNYPIFSPIKTPFFCVFWSRAFNPKIKGLNVPFVVTIFLVVVTFKYPKLEKYNGHNYHIFVKIMKSFTFLSIII